MRVYDDVKWISNKKKKKKKKKTKLNDRLEFSAQPTYKTTAEPDPPTSQHFQPPQTKIEIYNKIFFSTPMEKSETDKFFRDLFF